VAAPMAINRLVNAKCPHTTPDARIIPDAPCGRAIGQATVNKRITIALVSPRREREQTFPNRAFTHNGLNRYVGNFEVEAKWSQSDIESHGTMENHMRNEKFLLLSSCLSPISDEILRLRIRS